MRVQKISITFLIKKNGICEVFNLRHGCIVARGGSRGSAEPPLRNQNKKGPKYLNFTCECRKSKLDLLKFWTFFENLDFLKILDIFLNFLKILDLFSKIWTFFKSLELFKNFEPFFKILHIF